MQAVTNQAGAAVTDSRSCQEGAQAAQLPAFGQHCNAGYAPAKKHGLTSLNFVRAAVQCRLVASGNLAL